MKRIITFLSILLLLTLCMMPIFGASPRLVDDADILTDTEEKSLLATLDEVSTRQQCDVCIVTVYSLGGMTAEEYADDFYGSNGYGFGAKHDGILLLLSTEQRDWWFSTTGYGITAFTDAGQEYIMDDVLPLFGDDDYAGGFQLFAERSDAYLAQAKTGEPYDVGNLPKTPLSPIWIPISIGIGALIAFLIMLGMKSKMNSVKAAGDAAHYVRQDSLSVTDSNDLYLYSHVTRVARPKDTDSSGGSSTHVGSSGTTHGGSGGKF